MTLSERDGIRLRRAEPGDVDFIVELATDEEISPFLGAVTARDREAVLAEIDRSTHEPHEFGRFIVEVDGRPAGMMGFEVANRRSRIAHLERLAIHPSFRGRRLADAAARLLQHHLLFELGYHRLQLEIYAFNERAIHHAERSGFVREGVKRKAYWRHGEWVDAVMFGLLREDVDDRSAGEARGMAPPMDDERSVEEESRARVEERIDQAADEEQARGEPGVERMQDAQEPDQNEP
ncbi:MAG: GNAT family N-acetyltransferase [Actinomycetota bacterium]|nr:GNAT family N-acetyltransferase [Actinomycetota bacterium]